MRLAGGSSTSGVMRSSMGGVGCRQGGQRRGQVGASWPKGWPALLLHGSSTMRPSCGCIACTHG